MFTIIFKTIFFWCFFWGLSYVLFNAVLNGNLDSSYTDKRTLKIYSSIAATLLVLFFIWGTDGGIVLPLNHRL